MLCRQMLMLGPDNKPLWVRLYLQKVDGVWAAMIVRADELPPEPGGLKGLAFFGETSEEAERKALAYFGHAEPVN